MNKKIDVVIPWVDNADPIWRNEAKKYIPKSEVDGERYRNFDTLRFTIRSIEQNMSWVNHVFLVTANQKPKWFKENSFVSIVKHDEFIDAQYLPTYNSSVIESHFHKIPNLNDQFIVIEDDIFIVNKTSAEDYFYKGMPRDFLIERPTYPSVVHDKLLFNSMYSVNQIVKKRDEILKNIQERKLLNIKYGLINNIVGAFLMIFRPYLGFYNAHSVQPYRKETFFQAWSIFSEELSILSSHKIRNSSDVTNWLVRYLHLTTGDFYPSNPKKHKYFELGSLNDISLYRALNAKKYFDICINDSEIDGDIEYYENMLMSGLGDKFKTPSICEKV